MRSGLPAWHNLASQNEKICVQVSEYDESSWSYETHAAPIATSEFEIRYSLSKLTNGLINCFNVSLRLKSSNYILFIIRFALIVYDFCEAKRNSLFRLRY